MRRTDDGVVPITVRIPRDQKQRLQVIANRRRVSWSAALRMAIDLGAHELDRQDTPKAAAS